jgi:hypothetical protein
MNKTSEIMHKHLQGEIEKSGLSNETYKSSEFVQNNKLVMLAKFSGGKTVKVEKPLDQVCND